MFQSWLLFLPRWKSEAKLCSFSFALRCCGYFRLLIRQRIIWVCLSFRIGWKHMVQAPKFFLSAQQEGMNSNRSTDLNSSAPGCLYLGLRGREALSKWNFSGSDHHVSGIRLWVRLLYFNRLICHNCGAFSCKWPSVTQGQMLHSELQGEPTTFIHLHI